MENYRDLESPTPETNDTNNKDGEIVRAYLSWKDLKVTTMEQKHILQGLSGCAEPCRLLAIMGPSGSGKSTLLNTLAGRPSRDATVTGDILLNGHISKLSYGTAAFLPQEVDLLGTLTVYETLYFSAKLRFPDGTSESATKRIVMNTLEDVGLLDAMNTRVATWYKRGLSGGEKRRVGIATALLTSPTLIFLDEATSGLDSASAFFVIKTLKDLTRSSNRTILCSIHQPSSEVFELFDDLFLLSNGQQVYCGPLPEALQFFAGNGYPCPSLRSASDHYLHCVNSDFDSIGKNFIDQENTSADTQDSTPSVMMTNTRGRKGSAKETVALLTAACKLCDEKKSLDERIELLSHMDGAHLKDKASKASFLKQSFYLTIRSFVNMHRDVGYYWLRSCMYFALCLFIGTNYYNIGHNYFSVQARASSFTFVVSFLSFMAVGGFPSFIEDMKVFQNERLNGHYGVGAFVIGNTLSSMPFLLLITVISTALIYPIEGLNRGVTHVAYFLFTLYACLLVSEALLMAVSSIVSNFLLGILVGSGLQGTFMLVSGFFRFSNEMPKILYKYPLYYASYIMHSFQGIMLNEFHGQTFDGLKPGDPTISGDYVTTVLYQIPSHRSKWWNLVIIYSMFLGYRVIFFMLLKCRTSFLPLLLSYLKDGGRGDD